jgi:hypothetical protein
MRVADILGDASIDALLYAGMYRLRRRYYDKLSPVQLAPVSIVG